MLPFRFIEYTVKGKNFRIFYDDDNDGKKAFTKDRILAIIHQDVNTYKVMQPSIW